MQACNACKSDAVPIPSRAPSRPSVCGRHSENSLQPGLTLVRQAGFWRCRSLHIWAAHCNAARHRSQWTCVQPTVHMCCVSVGCFCASRPSPGHRGPYYDVPTPRRPFLASCHSSRDLYRVVAFLAHAGSPFLRHGNTLPPMPIAQLYTGYGFPLSAVWELIMHRCRFVTCLLKEDPEHRVPRANHGLGRVVDWKRSYTGTCCVCSSSSHCTSQA